MEAHISCPLKQFQPCVCILQETLINLQNEVHVHDEREMMLQHAMDLQAMKIKYLKEVSLVMKKIALQILDTCMLELENEVRFLDTSSSLQRKKHS